MITQLQTKFMKHYKWAAAILLGVVIVAFVLTIGNQSFFGPGAGGPEVREKQFYGYNLANQGDMQLLMDQARLSAYFNPELRVRGPVVEQYAYARGAALGLANAWGVMRPTKEQLQDYIRSKEVFQNEEGDFSLETYNTMVESLSGFASEQAVARVLGDDWRIERVREALGGPGYVLPFEAVEQYRTLNTEWAVKIARLPFGEFQPEISVTEQELQEYYAQNTEQFRQPEQVDAQVVRFNTQAFLEQVPQAPDEASLQTYFERNKRRFQPPPPPAQEGEEQPEQPEVTLEDVRDQVVQAYRQQEAQQLSLEAASDFTVRLYREQVPMGSDRFEALVQEFQGQVRDLDPFSVGQPPRDLPPQLAQAAADLQNAGRYFTDAARSAGGAAVLLYEETIPSRVPEFEEVRSEVETAFKEEKRRELFDERGQEVRDQLQQAVAQGQGFESTAEEVGLTVESFEDFQGNNPPWQVRSFWGQMQELSKGEISPMQFQRNQGTFIYVAEKQVPEADPADEAVAEAAEELREARRSADGWAVLFAMANKRLAEYEQPMAAE